jgi:signal transduction histidine kinase/CheY-like chemotaxis protein
MRGAPGGQADSRMASGLRTFSRLDGGLLVICAGAVLLGWVLGNQNLMRVRPGLVAMNPLTAFCFIGAGLSLASFWLAESRPSTPFRAVGRLLAVAVILAGALKTLDYALGWDLHLDQALFRAELQADHSGVPNRMAPNTALEFLLVGASLLLLQTPGRRSAAASQNLSLLAGFHALLAVLGYAYGANYLYGVGAFIPMALHTAVMFLLLSAGLLFARTDVGVMAVLVGATPGGVIARRLLPIAFAIPAILGALCLWGGRLRLYNLNFGLTLVVLIIIAAFAVLIWWNALLLNRADERRRQAEADLQQAHDDLERRVARRTADLVEANDNLRAEIAGRRQAEQRVAEQTEEKRKLEEQFLRAQRMESLGALAGGIAHDLNNALVPVLMGAEMLLLDSGGPSQRQARLQMITASAERCTGMVRQILNFARGSAAGTSTLQLRHLLRDMRKIALDTFPKNISVETSAPSDLWTVEGDATELHQVLMNLCVNARDAMFPNGGRLALAAQNVELDAVSLATWPGAQPGNYVALSVADTGSGIPPEHLPRIFEAFFTTKPPDRGTGLGLSTVAAIVKRHNGFVDVRSEPGKGSTFKILLPATGSASAIESSPVPADLPTGHGELVLVVDDEQMVLELAKSTLEAYGYRVLTAHNGLEAIACFEARKDEIRLMVTDTDMPFMDGLSAIQAIQKMKPGIAFIVASGAKRDTQHFARLDTLRLVSISKPYGVSQLVDGVARALSLAADQPTVAAG